MTDLALYEDIDDFASDTTSAEEELEQDVRHVLEQDLGSNLDDLERGLGIANALSKALTSELAELGQKMLEQDDRIKSAKITNVVDESGGPAHVIDTMQVDVEPNDSVLESLTIFVPIGGTTEGDE